MASLPDLVLSDYDWTNMQQFLESNGLQELEAIFLEKGVALGDLFGMTDKDMTDLGIKVYLPDPLWSNLRAMHSVSIDNLSMVLCWIRMNLWYAEHGGFFVPVE